MKAIIKTKQAFNYHKIGILPEHNVWNITTSRRFKVLVLMIRLPSKQNQFWISIKQIIE